MRPITPPGPIKITPDAIPTSKQLANRLRIFRAPRGMNVEIPRELVDQLVEHLDNHDARVTGLIRACSTEVIKRRMLSAHLKLALAALQKAAAKFRDYARQHRAKMTAEADGKAWVNDCMADEMDKAWFFEPNPDDYGKA